ncbi:uncharacterized protein SOCG_01874 [Schizosaccharomyces octosporus yFS286]|uniref:Uncharacterized protein n=1 Tax=Schizosaccharomyces octosporus (strain yFS286) TaxID=483514 RepID=S9RC21_SCHOY|nr:uncharacterized protein SOCG_01874 [Schizosaccharomyces octosporus yFS286]EPX71659.1 hypothetical protein SOCG_01874 [Schizosaccharomyces octosporus yFS286]
MKNKYTPVSDSDESFKTLIDEKADIHSSDGTPPPYSAPNKFIDLEMADGSAQHSAQESTNITGSDSTYSKWIIIIYLLFFASLGYIGAYGILLVMFFYFKVPVRAQDLWGLFGGFIGAISLFLYLAHMLYPGWYKQAGRVLSNMCAAALYVCFLNVPGFSMYYTAKKIMQFEKINNRFSTLFVLLILSLNPIARERLRLLVIDIGNGAIGIGNGANAIGNGIGISVNRVFGRNQGDEVPQNEEIELQPLAEQSGEV